MSLVQFQVDFMLVVIQILFCELKDYILKSKLVNN